MINKRLVILFVMILLCLSATLYSQQKFIITAEVPDNHNNLPVELRCNPVNTLPIWGGPSSKYAQEKKPMGRIVQWAITAEKPQYIYSEILPVSWALAEPGDSIYIAMTNNGPKFSGQGAAKFELLYDLEREKLAFEKLPLNKPRSLKNYSTESLDDYLRWHALLNRELSVVLPVIDRYKGRISPTAYEVIRAAAIAEIEAIRVSKFNSMMVRNIWENKNETSPKKFGLTAAELEQICDSTLYGVAARWLQDTAQTFDSYFVSFNRMEVYRREGFVISDSNDSKTERDLLFYDHAKKRFSGTIRELLLIRLLTYPLYKRGFTNETEMMLADYYRQPGFAVYKQQVKTYEQELRKKRLDKGWNAPPFVLTDPAGRPFTKEKLKGKIALLDFWFTGCVGCAQMTPALRQVEQAFKEDTNVVFLSISIDQNKEQWTKSIAQKKYTTGEGINLYTGGEGKDHAILTSYNVASYPQLYLIDAFGRIVQNPVPNPAGDNGIELINIIREQLAFLHDGPYVLYRNDSVKIYTINNNRVGQSNFVRMSVPALKVNTDELAKTFEVKLKSLPDRERSEYPQQEKMLVLSDIEGNFRAFRKLLQANKVIDTQYNWTFGKGHLVITGDMFDRGQQVTECLWLIYSLEEKAKVAGGFVHFILGNHEIMNLNGDTFYVQQKYKHNTSLLKKNYAKDLYGEQSELGRWLRTKNIAEKIGNNLFVHGGISMKVANAELSPEQINTIARPYYARDPLARNSQDKNVEMLFSWKTSPFWCRDYYDKDDAGSRKPGIKQLDTVLKRFGVDHIITGHTIVANHISVHYGRRVINTDTKHADGKSEALLIEGMKFYRVNEKGQRWLLFDDAHKN